MLEQLQTKHREIARLKFEGFKPAEIADQTGMSLSTVRGILSDPLCKAQISKLQDEADENVVDVRRRLAEMNVHALDVIEKILRDDFEQGSTRLKAAEGVLDRNGYAPKQQHEHAHLHLTGQEITDLKRRVFGERTISPQGAPT